MGICYVFPLQQEVYVELFFCNIFFKLACCMKFMIFVFAKNSTVRADANLISETDDV